MSDTTSLRTFYYNEQFKKHIVQFMNIFAGLRVKVGKTGDIEPRTVSCPVAYGSRDRVVASLKADDTQNKLLRLPMMSAYLNDIAIASEARKGVGFEGRQTYMPAGGLFPDDVEVVHTIQPIPYKLGFELAIYASNTDQHFQLLEQILMLFDPILQIQLSDDVFDRARSTVVELTDIRLDEAYPSGADRRIIQSSLGFSLIAYISAPAVVKKDYIKDIYLRLGMIGTSSDISNSDEVVAELDEQGVPYTLIFSVDDIKLN